MLFPKFNKPNRNPNRQPKELTQEAKKRFSAVLFMSLALLILYYGILLIWPAMTMVIMGIYMVAFAGLLVIYLIYNRGFVNKGVTEEMLPDTWNQEKKDAFIQGEIERAEKSRWMLVLIIPFAVVFMVEALYLFVWNGWLGNFFKG